MPFSITIKRTFCAAHALRLPGGATEPVHGHNWHVSVTVRRDDGGLDEIGCVVDFHELEKQLDAVIGPWKNADLNAIEPFASQVNPSAENVAATIAQGLDLPVDVRVDRVEITEAEGCLATWHA